MTSAYLAISFLKQTLLPGKQLRIFSNYLPQDPLKEYLSCSGIYKGRKNRSKHDLIDMIINEKDISIKEELIDDMSEEEAIKLLNNDNFAKPKISNKLINH